MMNFCLHYSGLRIILVKQLNGNANMQVTRLGSHLAAAKKLYAKRQDLLAQPYTLRSELNLYEHRLRLHLFMLRQAGVAAQEMLSEPAQTSADLFIQLATRDLAAELPNSLTAWLLDESLRVGVSEALVFYPPKDGGESLLNLYYVAPEIRPHLLQLWFDIGRSIPNAILQQALISSLSEVRQVALQCAAWLPVFTLAQARKVYQDVDLDCCLAALLAGLLRGDEQLPAMLSAISKDNFNPRQYEIYLHLLALQGDVQFVPVLQTYAADYPERGLPLLALHGDVSVVQTLLKALQNLTTAEPAAQAWWWLTGQTLSRKPRLTLMSKHNKPDKVSPVTVPNVDNALLWWEQVGQQWPAGRYLLGERVSQTHLQHVLQEYAGTWLQDLTTLQSVLQTAPVAELCMEWG
jgi:hypothetical protein